MVLDAEVYARVLKGAFSTIFGWAIAGSYFAIEYAK